MGKKRTKAIRTIRTKQTTGQEEEYKKAPHSFVFQRGHVGKNVLQLVKDMRQLMEPYTASRLQVRKKNVLKDFVNIAGELGVSHFLIYTKSDINVHLRMCRLPRGPTLTFRVHEYTLCKDVVSALKKPNMDPKQFNHHPLLVMNNFTGEEMHLKLMSTMFQNMFPSININKVNLNNIKRCVMINYNSADKTIDLRHYNVKVVPVGLSRGVKKLIKAEIPDLSRYNDVSDFITKGGNLSESEAELDGDHNEVVLPQDIRSRGNIRSAKSAIRKLKELRKKQQEENVRKKLEMKEEHKQKSLKGMRKEEGDVEEPEMGGNEDDDEDDDAAYYEEEVGEAPDPDLFQRKNRKRKQSHNSPVPYKKKRPSSGARGTGVKSGEKPIMKHNKGEHRGKFSKRPQKESFGKVKGKKGEHFKQKDRPSNKKAKRSGEITKKPKFKSKRKGRK